MTLDPDVLRRSVTRADHNDISKNGFYPGFIQFLVVSPDYTSSLPGPLPAYWSRARDKILRGTVYQEAMWASSVGIACTKMASLGWEVESVTKGTAPLLTKRLHGILHGADAGKGWVTFISKHLRDYLCTDNGAFVEVIRGSNHRGSRILGIMHLDSLRCTRTGDPKYPLLYRDLLGREHILKDYQCLMLSDMPDPGETYNGVGLCSASRAYPAIMKLAAMEQYLWEKVSGSKSQAIYLVKGIGQENFQAAMAAADQDQKSQGNAVYKGAIIVPFMGDFPMEMITIPLAELPDKFDRKEEFDLAVLTYANALGLDVQDLQPLTGQALGSGAQSQVLDDKASGKGLSAWRQQFMHLLNEYIAPNAVNFHFIEKDWRDIKIQSDINSEYVDMVSGAVESGILTAEQALQVLVDKEVFPREFIKTDETSAVSISDDEKEEVVTNDGAEKLDTSSNNGNQNSNNPLSVLEQFIENLQSTLPETPKEKLSPLRKAIQKHLDNGTDKITMSPFKETETYAVY